QQAIDAGLGEIGIDGVAAFAFSCRYPTVDLHGYRPAEISTDIEAELAATGIVESGLNADFRVGIATWLAIVERSGDAVDLHVAPDVVALIVGAHAQICRFDLLTHYQPFSGKAGKLHADGVLSRAV